MTSEVSICNLALMRLGQAPITALTEDSKAGIACNANYAPARDAILRAQPWNFAIKRAELAQEDVTPEFEFAYQYTLPTDFLKIIRTEDESEAVWTEYRIEGRRLLTHNDTAKIEYIAQITDPNLFDPLFVDLLAARLAAEMCAWLTDNQSAAEKLWAIYDTKLKEARGVDAQEGTPRDIIADEWIVSRL